MKHYPYLINRELNCRLTVTLLAHGDVGSLWVKLGIEPGFPETLSTALITGDNIFKCTSVLF